jgi:methylenetetrahydrofolate reductase (NADPH)
MINFSIEFFPPKSRNLEDSLWDCLDKIKPFKPSLVSVTYGADGSTRDRTHSIVKKIVEDTEIICAPHLTCVNASKEEIKKILHAYEDLGIESIVALRGDKPSTLIHKSNDYSFAHELILDIKSRKQFKNIFVAAYPEKHPEAKTMGHDIDNLKRKIDNGATAAITQFFFNNDFYYDFLNKCQQMSIAIPIIPGILPINDFNRVSKFSEKCGTSVPDTLFNKFQQIKEGASHYDVSLEVLTTQVNDLISQKINSFHFYSLNQPNLMLDLFKAIK